ALRDLHSFPTRRSSDLHRRLEPCRLADGEPVVRPLPRAGHGAGDDGPRAGRAGGAAVRRSRNETEGWRSAYLALGVGVLGIMLRSEEHTSELQSLAYLV